MVRVALRDLPGADAAAEEALAPLLSAGALERANVPPDLPDFFVDQLFFPYVEGTAYVRRAVARGGWKEVDRLWLNPPVSTSEILHDESRPRPATDLLPADGVRLAPAGSRHLYSDTIGEWAARYLLRRSLTEPESIEAASGWRGDRIAFFAAGRSLSYVWRLRFDTPGSAVLFETALKRARTGRPDPPTVVRSDADVVVTVGFPAVPELPGFRSSLSGNATPRRPPAS
jgi:hypothetical protein